MNIFRRNSSISSKNPIPSNQSSSNKISVLPLPPTKNPLSQLSLSSSEAGWNPLDRLSGLKPHQVAEKNIRFHGPQLPKAHPAEPNDLVINSYKAALKFLIKFGSAITSLTLVGGSFEESELSELSRHIAFYTENTLREITLIDSGEVLLYKTNSAFPNVVAVHLNYYNLSHVDLELHRIYPALQDLTLTIGEPTQRVTLANQNLQTVIDSVRFNPQLISLTLTMPTVSMHDLAAVAELQALEALTVNSIIRTDVLFPVNFPNVQNFTGALLESDEVYYHPCPVTFDRLERLHITSIVHGSQEMPFKLIEQNAGLKALTMPLIVDISAVDQLLNRIGETHDLKRLEMTWTVAACRREPLPNFGDHFKQMTFVVSHCDGVRNESNRILTKLPAYQWAFVSELIDSKEKVTVVIVERVSDSDEEADEMDEPLNGDGFELPQDFPQFPAEPKEDDSDESSHESYKSGKSDNGSDENDGEGEASDTDSESGHSDEETPQIPIMEGEEWANKWID